MTMAVCGKPCEIYSRVVGYHRPVNLWNEGKRAEYNDRKEYNINKSMKREVGNALRKEPKDG